MADRSDVYRLLDAERKHQDTKHGTGREIPIIGWIAIMEEELREAKIAWMKSRDDGYAALCELSQATAVGVACLEEHLSKLKHPHCDAGNGSMVFEPNGSVRYIVNWK